MKLIGIGLERLPVRVMSYVERAKPSTVAANAMERWYFQPNYDGVAVSEDGFAMKIKERGVQLVGANERVANGGQRVASGRVNKASQAFCLDFTNKLLVLVSLHSEDDASVSINDFAEIHMSRLFSWIKNKR